MWRCVVRDLRSFMVKVYRQQAGTLVGTVQEVRTGRTVPFQTMEELWLAVRGTSPHSGTGLSGSRRGAAGKYESSERDRGSDNDDKQS
jgi:hypothetical protein